MATFVESIESFKSFNPQEYQHNLELSIIQKYFAIKENNGHLNKVVQCKLLGVSATKLNALLKKHGYTNFLKTRKALPQKSQEQAVEKRKETIKIKKELKGGNKNETLINEHSVFKL